MPSQKNIGVRGGGSGAQTRLGWQGLGGQKRRGGMKGGKNVGGCERFGERQTRRGCGCSGGGEMSGWVCLESQKRLGLKGFCGSKRVGARAITKTRGQNTMFVRL